MSATVRKLLVLLPILFALVLVFPFLKHNYDNLHDYIIEEKIYKTFGDSVLVFPFATYKCTGVIQFQLNREKQAISYNCMVSADSGFYLSDSSHGAITFELNDRFGFLIDKVILTKKTNIADTSDFVSSYIYRGDFEMPVRQFAKLTSITAFNTLTFMRKASQQETIEVKPKKKSKKNDKPAPVSTSTKEEDLQIWSKKAERIRVGMTYRDMISTAGEPRYTERVTSQERIVNGYDEVKYNYGSKWVYLKRKVVAMIR